jgi:ABC-type dipeptide/oligopeptide/nickel transport system permease component
VLRFVLARIGGGLAAIFGASIISFVLLRLVPGNPARLVLGPQASEDAIRQLTSDMGLNAPIWTQYWEYVSHFLRGDWGFSYSAGESVASQIGSRVPASLELGLAAFIFVFALGVLLALLVTYRRRPVLDGFVRGLAFIGLGTPPFWLGLVLLLVFFSKFGIFPGPDGRLSSDVTPPPEVTGLITVDGLIAGDLRATADALWHLVLPAISLGLVSFALVVRLLRANLLEVSREPFVLVARSKGLSRWQAHTRHALPNAFLPTLTTSGLLLAQMIAGSVVVEKVFNWPGLGQLVVNAILRQDFGVVQTFILLAACAYVAVNLLVDLLYGVIDPRVRTQDTA